MNRKQRRAKGVKNSDPAFMVRQSDMQSHIDRLLKSDPIVQQVIQEEAHRVNLLEAKKQAEDIDALILMTLHDIFGFGKTRLLRFAKGLAELQKYYEDRYEDCDIFAMKMYLKDNIGIDVSELQKEVERVAAEESSNKG